MNAELALSAGGLSAAVELHGAQLRSFRDKPGVGRVEPGESRRWRLRVTPLAEVPAP